jgi:ubiquinone/menaquinone biosynthesis C-methylase UbiE
MVEKAKSRYPGVPFGLLHVARPDRVMKEAWRVLKSGGRYTFTVWCSPDQGGEFFRLVMGAVQKHGTLDVPLPPAPPMFRFSDPTECAKALTAAGFVAPRVAVLPLSWRATTPTDVLDLIYKGAVRTPMVLEAQTTHAREAIHRAIIEGSEAFRKEGVIEFRFPASMASATKN